MNDMFFPADSYTGLRMNGPMPGTPPSYAQGGMIGPGGQPEPMGAGLAPAMGQDGAMSPQSLQMQLKQFVAQNPQQVQQIKQGMMQAMQSGEFTPQELNMIVQLATIAAQNPEMYSYVRNFAIQQGIAEQDDIPPQYDQGLIFTILLAGQALQAGGPQQMDTLQMGGGQQAMPLQGGAAAMGAPPSMAMGGPVPDSKKRDGSVLINAHEGEYVIPANVVRMKGKEFFDSLVEKYKQQ